jgi:uncharacterized membrane protein
MKRTIIVVTAILATLGIGFAVEHFLDLDHYNPGFDEHPIITRLHVALGGLYLGLAMLQFVGAVRSRFPRLHRVSGRIAVVAGIASGVTALLITAMFPFSGPIEMAVVGPFACLFLLSLCRGLWLARARRFAEHREWMIRAMAVATSIATMRLIFVPALVVMGASEELARWLSLTSFGIAFVIHSAVAEAWIRSTREGSSRKLVDQRPVGAVAGR